MAAVIAVAAFAQPAQAQGRIRVEAIDTGSVEEGDDVDGEYELTVSGGEISDITISSSLCGPLTRPDGDDNDDDILDEDETWQFECSDEFDGTIDTVTVIGFDEDGETVRDFDQREVEFEAAEDDTEDGGEGEEDEGEDDAAADDDEDDGDGGSNVLLFMGLLGAIVMCIALALLYLLWRRRQLDSEPRIFV